MPITFSGLVGSLANSYKLGKTTYDWLTNAKLKKDFEVYLHDLETRRVLYEEWRYEDINAVLASLSEILTNTRKIRSEHSSNHQASKLLESLIRCIQKESEKIRGCNMHSRQGEYMAYRALLKIRTELARVLAIFCGMIDVDPRSTSLRQFIMNMAVVRPRE